MLTHFILLSNKFFIGSGFLVYFFFMYFYFSDNIDLIGQYTDLKHVSHNGNIIKIYSRMVKQINNNYVRAKSIRIFLLLLKVLVQKVPTTFNM
jgi:hypothetical protein